MLAGISALRLAGVSLPDIRVVLEAEEKGGRGRDVALDKLAGRRKVLAAE
ncbi:MAG: hypothetical protein Q8Q88_23575 [Phenylobacterium sp.]|nr:hypothetical protein [Phenylobacterium sp.]MDP3750018.1 hypothetical protein [Phenylobacterium sp.]